MGLQCEHCGSILATTTNLLKHQRDAKYCLKLQGKTAKNSNFACQCGKVYTRIDNLTRHQQKCQHLDTIHSYEKIVITMAELQNKNVDNILSRMLDILSTKSSGNNNNNNNRNMVLNNLSAITDEQLQEDLEHLTLNFIQEGAKGYADYANSYPLKDNIVCTDRARQRIRYKNEEGLLTDDSRELAKRFFKAISSKNEELINQKYSEIHEQIQGIVAENRAHEVDITALFTRATELQDVLMKCQRAAEGKNEEFTQEFIKHLTKTL